MFFHVGFFPNWKLYLTTCWYTHTVENKAIKLIASVTYEGCIFQTRIFRKELFSESKSRNTLFIFPKLTINTIERLSILIQHL